MCVRVCRPKLLKKSLSKSCFRRPPTSFYDYTLLCSQRNFVNFVELCGSGAVACWCAGVRRRSFVDAVSRRRPMSGASRSSPGNCCHTACVRTRTGLTTTSSAPSSPDSFCPCLRYVRETFRIPPSMSKRTICIPDKEGSLLTHTRTHIHLTALFLGLPG